MILAMHQIREMLRTHRPLAILLGIILALTTIPYIGMFLMLGTPWPSIMPVFGDEPFNPARVQTIVKGSFIGGSPYFLEHHHDVPLVIFAGAWINALPQLAGLSYAAAILFNFILWSMLFALALYWLFRELRTSPWIAVFGTVMLFLQDYAHIWRPINLQPVYPFYFLWNVALVRLLRNPNRRDSLFLAGMTGSMFYLYSYLWQAFVITLGLLLLYAWRKKETALVRETLVASLVGIGIGLPMLLYTFWISQASPYFWESFSRLGLVHTHIPMAEILYSGGWVGVIILFLAILLWRNRALRQDATFSLTVTFLILTSLGLWVMQGSNLITGKLLETGEHLRLFILPWLLLSTVWIAAALWQRRALLSTNLRAGALCVLVIMSIASAHYTYDYFSPFMPLRTHPDLWHREVTEDLWVTEQRYAAPFAWLQEHEKTPVVVWSDPHDFITPNLPTFTRHFTLYAMYGMLELMSESEVRERYLVSQYFNNPTLADLRTEREMRLYLGRGDYPHKPKTIEREIKICRVVYFFDQSRCGTPPSYQSHMGDAFFEELDKKFQTDIKPNIKAYLKKYHVTYILKDIVLDPAYTPEALGAKRVYADDRYEIWHL